MVLHLLGKKSWNVYNTDNVERVRRDEAAAQARQEAEEQRMQEEDAATRIALLRGEPPPAAIRPVPSPLHESSERRRRRDDDSQPRKRRRLRGEDDTDRDIRIAKEDAEAGAVARQALVKHAEDGDAPLQDHAGHIQLIAPPDEKALRKAEKNAEAEAEKAKKRRREEDQYTMRFSNAAGLQNGMAKPWYTSSKDGGGAKLPDEPMKDVWGNEDPRRREREHSRISSSDPFAAMQQAQRQLKQSEADKEKWRRKRLDEVAEVKSDERRERTHRRRDADVDSLDGFALDAPVQKRSDHGRSHRRHHRRHRSRSRDRRG
ncbi:hypothetical protein BDY17DRAFT_319583 [Neohortaea acidophila]|uniref:CBF1-interacting co-repressor CIR N-terminal domain-containing protein n=1 Tax=Neohortaea acidophila TaxID=245834 RepID=A0A6A6Q5U9_9PEZI|nr:uncharacterized protein BDY17DRAFT_319583 [Neohortaea acidophila]KAF2487013.1 hypothetical protein BDY17DRAFT_319583 [Neohortaea acidophila]